MLKDPLINKPDNLKWIKGVGIFQIIGGVMGLVFIFVALIGSSQNILDIFLFPSFYLFAFSIYAGVCCFYILDNCLNVTLINQTLQIFTLFAGQYIFQYTSGISIQILVDFSDGFNLGLNFFLSTCNISINNNEGTYIWGINFIAIYIIYKIQSIKKEMKEKKDTKERLHKYNQ